MTEVAKGICMQRHILKIDRLVMNGRKRTATGVRATAVQYASQFGALLLSFEDHSAVALPVNNYPELAVLNETDLQSLTLGFGGSALCLDTHDLHKSLAGMLTASQPLMNIAASLIAVRNGQKSSAIKSAAARENGRKGGRPKLVLAV
jgi:hypothetical protein